MSVMFCQEKNDCHDRPPTQFLQQPMGSKNPLTRNCLPLAPFQLFFSRKHPRKTKSPSSLAPRRRVRTRRRGAYGKKAIRRASHLLRAPWNVHSSVLSPTRAPPHVPHLQVSAWSAWSVVRGLTNAPSRKTKFEQLRAPFVNVTEFMEHIISFCLEIYFP